MPASRPNHYVSRSLLALLLVGNVILSGCHQAATPTSAEAERGVVHTMQGNSKYRPRLETPSFFASKKTLSPPPITSGYTIIDSLIKISWPSHFRPLHNGTGIIVCDPVSTSSGHELAYFGIGCGRWLGFVLGGLPELGTTPSWYTIQRARQELQKPNLALNRIEASAPYAAIGTISGSSSYGVLTYQLVKIPEGRPVGSPIRIAGSASRIVSHLPDIAHELAHRLGIASPPIAESVGVGATQLTDLGRLAWLNPSHLTFSQSQQLRQLSISQPFAGLIYLESGRVDDEVALTRFAKRLVSEAPNNAMVFAEVGAVRGGRSAISAISMQLKRLIKQYPRNYLLECVSSHYDRLKGNTSGAIQEAIYALRSNLGDPDAWMLLAGILSDEAEAVRKSRYISDIKPDELAGLERVYLEWQQVAEAATRIDPDNAVAWLTLSTAAAFDGDENIADAAYWKALDRINMSSDRSSIYWWGLQLYQPKWYANPGKLARVADIAVKDSHMTLGGIWSIAGSLHWAGFEPLSKLMFDKFITRSREDAHHNTNDPLVHYRMADVYSKENNLPAALGEYQQVERLEPTEAEPHYEAGILLYRMRLLDKAKHEFENALHFNPQFSDAHYELGCILKAENQYLAAQREFVEALRIAPNNAYAYYGLGKVASEQGHSNEAIRYYKDAILISPYFGEANRDLCALLSRKGDYDAAIRAGLRAITGTPNDPGAHDALEYSYAMKGEIDQSIAQCRAAIRLNPADALAHENLGDNFAQKHETAKAISEWRLVLKLAPSGRPAQEAQQMLAKYCNR
ncbi:MAG: tetratricopeptide repeat protein [Armatimonadetes bacterium]|nr:tetratricopeptide repeat protein [Armatimonadota bacterium]